MSAAPDGPPRRRLLFGTTSYVLPADLLPNVELLAPYVDDMELILFEGDESNLPSPADVREMGRMAAEGGCGFTVHLPLDVGIGELDPAARHRAQETCLRVIDLTLPLEPHAFVVHPELPLVYHPALGEPPAPLDRLDDEEHAAWQEALGESFGRFASEVGRAPLAVENLQFPYRWVRPLLDELDLGVTMDVGHLLSHGGDVASHLAEFGDRLSVVHLHGIVDGRDHREIGAFDRAELEAILAAIARAGARKPAWSRGDGARSGRSTKVPPPDLAPLVVSLEVFGWQPTVPSLRTLAGLLRESPSPASLGVSDREGAVARLDAAADAVMAALPAWDPGA